MSNLRFVFACASANVFIRTSLISPSAVNKLNGSVLVYLVGPSGNSVNLIFVSKFRYKMSIWYEEAFYIEQQNKRGLSMQPKHNREQLCMSICETKQNKSYKSMCVMYDCNDNDKNA